MLGAGDFDLEKIYVMEIYMFEGDNKQGTVAPNQPSAIIADNVSCNFHDLQLILLYYCLLQLTIC